MNRLSARAAAVYVAKTLQLNLRPPLSASGEVDLTDLEAHRFRAALRRAGTQNMIDKLGKALVSDTPRTKGAGRTGRPRLHRVHARMRKLLDHIERRSGERDHLGNRRGIHTCAAYLLLLFEFDTHRVFWRNAKNDDRPPPGARDRVRWLSERIGDVVEKRDGEYAVKKARSTIAR